MPKRRDEDEETALTVGTYAALGPGFAAARALGGILGEGRSSLDDLGPAPIGSDPWLEREVGRALAREEGLAAIEVEAHEAVVTLRGTVPTTADLARAERAARTVQGIKRLEVALATR